MDWNHLSSQNIYGACGVNIKNIVRDESQERDNFKWRL